MQTFSLVHYYLLCDPWTWQSTFNLHYILMIYLLNPTDKIYLVLCYLFINLRYRQKGMVLIDILIQRENVNCVIFSICIELCKFILKRAEHVQTNFFYRSIFNFYPFLSSFGHLVILPFWRSFGYFLWHSLWWLLRSL
jgi:hypothetical protein